MTKFTFSYPFESFQSLKPSGSSRQQFNQQALLRRMDRLGSRSSGARRGALSLAPQHLDARLLEDGAALEAAWQAELRAMIVQRRTRTPEAEAAAKAARAAAAAIVTRIETARALTLDGLKAQARAVLWRRDGVPLGPEIPDDQASDDAWTEMGELPRW
jgi:hypothetical protein